MATTNRTYVKILPPWQLNNADTLQPLEKRYKTFKLYYKKEKEQSLPTTTWDSVSDTYGSTAEQTGLKLQPLELKEDCVSLCMLCQVSCLKVI